MKKLYFLSFFLLFAIFAQAQTDLKKIVPPNPNVASLFKSVITPVTEYSGLPNVSIPLYTANEGGISVPISLSYATGGIQVSEEAGIVGLGWALNAGGAITRTVNGLDDFRPQFGYLNHNRIHPSIPIEVDPINGAWNPDTHSFVDALNINQFSEEPCQFPVGQNRVSTPFNLPPQPGSSIDDYDYRPDLFYFSFNGYSGSFVFNSDGQPVLLNKKGITVRTFGSGIPNFEILTEDGSIYEFDVVSTTSFPNAPINRPYASAWYLSKITDIYGNAAFFNYDTSEKFIPFRSFTQSYSATTGTSSSTIQKYEEFAGPISETNDVFLTSIEIRKATGNKTQEVSFNYSQNRLDNDSRYLESIVVSDSQLNPINRYDLDYCYFGQNKSFDYRDISLANGDFGQEIGALGVGMPHLNLRLRLDAVTENNISTHSFEYYEPTITPNKTTMGQDYWGFYNGQYNADIFIPYLYSHIAQFSTFNQEKRAKRLPSENFSKTFSLKKIIYPTKGSTEFDYELNTYDDLGNFNDAPIPTVPKSEVAYRNSTPDIDDDDYEVIIKPNRFGVLKLTYSITFTGWNTSVYPNGKPTTRPDFLNDFYLEFRDMNDNLMTSRVNIPSDTMAWDELTVEQNANYGAVIKFEDVQEWRYDINTINKLTDDEYKLVAHFDSNNGLWSGLVQLHAEWEDVDVDVTKDYSIGGGLRVASITDFDNDGTLETKRSYNYHYEQTLSDGTKIEKSYGKIKTLPNFAVDQIAVLDLAIKSYKDQDPSSGDGYGYLPVVIGSATSHNSMSKDYGSYVGYDQVEVRTIGNEGDNGKTIKYFANQVDHFRSISPPTYEDSYTKFAPVRVPHNGLLKKQENYKKVSDDEYTLISATENLYTINGIEENQFNLFRLYENQDRVIAASKELPVYSLGEEGLLYWFCDAMKFQLYPYYSNLIQQTGTSQTIWDTNGENPVTTIQEFKYENPTHLQRTESKLTNSKGEEVITKTFYADDIALAGDLDGPDLTEDEMTLINYFKKDTEDTFHRIAEPIQVETTVNGEKTIQRTSYQDWDEDPNNISYKIWPLGVKTLKGDFDTTDTPTKNLLENRLNYHEYDGVGNPLEVSKEDGVKIAYLWGYDLKYPVAKIENSTFDGSLSAALGALPSGYSDLDTFMKSLSGIEEDALKKQAWKDFNDDFRAALSDQMISTYTYDPLVGVTSVTDPRGYTIYYIYDAQNRLKEVRDAAGDLVTDYEYHYKGQTNNQ